MSRPHLGEGQHLIPALGAKRPGPCAPSRGVSTDLPSTLCDPCLAAGSKRAKQNSDPFPPASEFCFISQNLSENEYRQTSPHCASQTFRAKTLHQQKGYDSPSCSDLDRNQQYLRGRLAEHTPPRCPHRPAQPPASTHCGGRPTVETHLEGNPCQWYENSKWIMLSPSKSADVLIFLKCLF